MLKNFLKASIILMKKSQTLALVMIICALLPSCSDSSSDVTSSSDTVQVEKSSEIKITDVEALSSPAGLLINVAIPDGIEYSGEASTLGALVIRDEMLEGELNLQTENAVNIIADDTALNESGRVYNAEFSEIGAQKEDYTALYTAVAYATYEKDGERVTEYSSPVSMSYYSVCKNTQDAPETIAEAIAVCESASINSLYGAFSANVTGFDGMVSGYDNNYIITKTATVKAVSEEKKEFNKFTVVYTATADMKAKITYRSGEEKITESFYLAAGENVEYTAFIDGAAEGETGDVILSYEFSNTTEQSEKLTLTSLSAKYEEIPDSNIYIENNSVKLGIDLISGGAVSYYENLESATGDVVNIIYNSYLGSDEYPHGNDKYTLDQTYGKLIDYSVTSKSITVKVQPYDASNDVLADSYIETVYTLYSDCVQVQVSVSDFYEFGHENRERQYIPSVVPLSKLSDFYSYTGSDAWTDGAYSKLTSSVEFPSSSNERWLVSADSTASVCLGIYAPSADGIETKGITRSLYKNEYLPTNGKYTSYYLLTAGSMSQVRSVFLANKDFAPEEGVNAQRPASDYDSYSVDGDYIVTKEGLKAPNKNNNTFGPLVGFSDTGLVIDGMNNSVGVVNEEKYVGLFYFLWLGEHGDYGVYDNMKILAQYSDAARNTSRWGPVGSMHFYTEPLYGYYKSNDRWVMRKHVEQLTNAGVDFLYIDCTNGYPYIENAKALMSILHEYNAMGWDAPKIVFYTHTDSAGTITQLYNNIYATKYYPDTWFCLEGRPVVVGFENQLSTQLRNFFTVREAQWPNESSQRVNGWPWISFFKWNEVYYNDSGKREAISVSVAQHCSTVTFSIASLYGPTRDRGRSYRNGNYNDSYNGDNSYLYGYNFQETWDRAIKEDVPVVLVTGWNEWVAQRQKSEGSHTIMFIDCFDVEFSRDCEMAKGYYFDNYYMQLMYNINRYKGTAPTLIQPQRQDGCIRSMSDWVDVQVDYLDAKGDAIGRNTYGFGNTSYVNQTNRNDITNAKVCFDSRNFYFYVKCTKNISTDKTGTSLNLYINTDMSASSGWYGYDYIVDWESVSKYTGNGKTYSYTQSASVEYILEGNELMITVPRSALGLTSDNVKFCFKWADSKQKITTMEQMYTDGDTAPHGRLNYLFQNY